MKIISKFKDYYDVLSGVYGSDPKIRLDRAQELPREVVQRVAGGDMLQVIKIDHYYETRWSKDSIEGYCYRNKTNIDILVVCGKMYYVESGQGSYALVSQEAQDLLCKEKTYNWKTRISRKLGVEDFMGRSASYIDEVSKKVGSPIFIIKDIQGAKSQYDYTFTIDEKVPNLSQIKGFPKLYDANQLYQDVSYWVANILNASPDVQPPGNPELTSKEKVLIHGFDAKKSFRHRT